MKTQELKNVYQKVDEHLWNAINELNIAMNIAYKDLEDLDIYDVDMHNLSKYIFNEYVNLSTIIYKYHNIYML